jgi:hypothetical protein
MCLDIVAEMDLFLCQQHLSFKLNSWFFEEKKNHCYFYLHWQKKDKEYSNVSERHQGRYVEEAYLLSYGVIAGYPAVNFS